MKDLLAVAALVALVALAWGDDQKPNPKVDEEDSRLPAGVKELLQDDSNKVGEDRQDVDRRDDGYGDGYDDENPAWSSESDDDDRHNDRHANYARFRGHWPILVGIGVGLLVLSCVVYVACQRHHGARPLCMNGERVGWLKRNKHSTQLVSLTEPEPADSNQFQA